jgi:hypothetical protein
MVSSQKCSLQKPNVGAFQTIQNRKKLAWPSSLSGEEEELNVCWCTLVVFMGFTFNPVWPNVYGLYCELEFEELNSSKEAFIKLLY